MWNDSIRNIVVIFQPNILRIVVLYVRHSATNSDALFWPVTLLQLCYPSSGQADHYLSLSQQTFFGLITRYPKCPSEAGTPFTSECKVG